MTQTITCRVDHAQDEHLFGQVQHKMRAELPQFFFTNVHGETIIADVNGAVVTIDHSDVEPATSGVPK